MLHKSFLLLIYFLGTLTFAFGQMDYTFDSSRAIKNSFKKIKESLGIEEDIRLKASPEVQIVSTVKQGKKWIIYNKNWVYQVHKKGFSLGVTWIILLAHELAHHQLGHFISENKTNLDKEIEADIQAGKILAQMGVPRDTVALLYGQIIPEFSTVTHPNKRIRIEKVLKGYDHYLINPEPKLLEGYRVRDVFGQEYHYRELVPGKLWLTQNLITDFNQNAPCFAFKDTCKQLGRYYTWKEAKIACEQIIDTLNWRLPNEKDWVELFNQFGGYYDRINRQHLGNPEKTLGILIQTGPDKFNAQLGGWLNPDQSFSSVKNVGSYWSSSANTSNVDQGITFGFEDSLNKMEVYRSKGNKATGRSCRCVRDKN